MTVTDLFPMLLREVSFRFARSSGKGGQNVNKVSTKAVLFWDLASSQAFLPLERELIRNALATITNREGVVVISDESTRSQDENKRRVLEKLIRIISTALRPRKKRVKTKPTRSSKERRHTSKRHRSNIKRQRRGALD